jgi:hypothetical protein
MLHKKRRFAMRWMKRRAVSARPFFEVNAGSGNQAMSFSTGSDMSVTADGVVVTAEYQTGGDLVGSYHALGAGPYLGSAFFSEVSGVAVLVVGPGRCCLPRHSPYYRPEVKRLRRLVV